MGVQDITNLMCFSQNYRQGHKKGLSVFPESSCEGFEWKALEGVKVRRGLPATRGGLEVPGRGRGS